MLSIHLELLDKERKEAFEKLKPFRRIAFLAGGTALALQIAHRYSFDFDLFLERQVERKDFLRLKRNFNIKMVKINTDKQLTVLTKNDIGITLVHYEHKPLLKKVNTSSLFLYSTKDIAADKAFTIGQRAAWRDYVDLFFLLKQGYIQLNELIKLAERKFKIEFNRQLFLEQLVYFDDLEITKVAFVKEEYSAAQIQEFLKREVLRYTKAELNYA